VSLLKGNIQALIKTVADNDSPYIVANLVSYFVIRINEHQTFWSVGTPADELVMVGALLTVDVIWA